MLLIQKDVQFLQNIACSYNRNSCAVQAEYAGKDMYAFSEKWFSTNKDLIYKVKNNLANYLLNIAKGHTQDSMWTTYDKDLLKGKGYTKGFVELYSYKNPKGLFFNKTNLSYIANVFYPVREKLKNPELTDEQYALYNLLNFIFQSGLYYGKEINIYIPSKRMRTLLEKWINEQNYEEVQ